MSDLRQNAVCERCDGDGYVATGPVVGGCTMVKDCPKCKGSGKKTVEPSGTHFQPSLCK
jgi:DnaJ-class molecular chaperone